MTRTVGIVTDSTSYLPTDLCEQKGIIKVPVDVIVGDKSYHEGIDISTAEVAQALRDGLAVTTSRPTPAEMLKAYQQLADMGYTSIVSTHLSSKLSGTYDSAVIAAREAPIPVTVIDSQTIALAMGLAVNAGADAAIDGKDTNQVAEIVRSRCAASHIYFYVDTLEYLRRGGRIGAVSAVIGNMLRVKPILYVHDGAVEFLEKTRTASRALQRIADLAVESTAGEPADFSVQHFDAEPHAQQLAGILLQARPDAEVTVGELGAVVGTHTGPGMCAVSVSPRTK